MFVIRVQFIIVSVTRVQFIIGSVTRVMRIIFLSFGGREGFGLGRSTVLAGSDFGGRRGDNSKTLLLLQEMSFRSY